MKLIVIRGLTVVYLASPATWAEALERVPIGWTHPIDKNSAQIQLVEDSLGDRIGSVRSEYALDCGKAKSSTERAICSDPAALAADGALGRAFALLRDRLPEKEKGDLKRSQIAWIHDRDENCGAETDLLAGCLAKQSIERQKFLEGRPQAGPGTPTPIEPRFFFRGGGKKIKTSVEAFKFNPARGPGEKKFNAEMEKFVQRALRGMDDEYDLDGSSTYFVDLKASLAYASPQLISAHLNYESFEGQPHPYREYNNINVDLKTGRSLSFDDLLDKENAEKIFSYCKTFLKNEKAEHQKSEGFSEPSDEVNMSEVVEKTGRIDNWSFGAELATVSYDDDAFGGYAECMCSCEIPYTILRPLVKASFPLP
ncbi:lysozyme inhibitor LprI family protein [Methylocapsa acidiphila]|uniref:lysozyme inhibitor LprI family protein n=1 Tax=Methylocapsa acidiphila TaxID=133552 RepID=UPI000420F3C7|nr:lysozyme inhibitor LprI family protein [Methylocapsa acidiphila]